MVEFWIVMLNKDEQNDTQTDWGDTLHKGILSIIQV